MRKTTEYVDFFGEEMARLARKEGKERTKRPRIICPDCQKDCRQDDADYTLDCKNLYTHTPEKYTINGIEYTGSDHHQCLCYSREHGIRIEAIETELSVRMKNLTPELEKYLLELLEYQLQRKHQPDWYQAKVREIRKKYFIETAGNFGIGNKTIDTIVEHIRNGV